MSVKTALICLKSSFLALLLLFLQPVFGQTKWAQLDEELQSKQKLLGNNVVTLIWKGDSLVYKKEMGEFNAKTQAPIASCSKWLTTALVMIMVDEGKISLDDPVVKYIPVFSKYFKSYITIRQCLSHMTGISDEGGFLKKLFQRKKIASLEEEVNGFAERDIRANPGNDFWYGGIGLNIAGRVLEIVSKKRFDLLIKQKLFNPLTMRRTTFSTIDGSAVNPSGGAQSTAEDYLKFLTMLLKNGKYNGQQILSEKSVALMRQIQDRPDQIKYAPAVAQGLTYALGSWVLESKGNEATSLTSPGLFGSWPVVDFCRGYCYIIFVKTLLGEEKADVNKYIKELIDRQFPATCP